MITSAPPIHQPTTIINAAAIDPRSSRERALKSVKREKSNIEFKLIVVVVVVAYFSFAFVLIWTNTNSTTTGDRIMYCNFESSHLAEWGNCLPTHLPYPYHTLHNNGTSGGNFCTDHHHHQHRLKHHSSLVVHDTGQGTYFALLYVRTLDD